MKTTTEAQLRRLDTVEGRRESLIDTFASWALEGFRPSAQDIELGQAYIDGTLTPDQIIQITLDRIHASKSR